MGGTGGGGFDGEVSGDLTDSAPAGRFGDGESVLAVDCVEGSDFADGVLAGRFEGTKLVEAVDGGVVSESDNSLDNFSSFSKNVVSILGIWQLASRLDIVSLGQCPSFSRNSTSISGNW